MSANTEHARILASLGANYSNQTARLYEQQGQDAARAAAQSGQIWGGAISNIGQIAAQGFMQANTAFQDEAIHKIFEKYGTDLEKALPEIYKIDPERGHKIASQAYEQQKWAYDLKDLAWQADGRKYQMLLQKVGSITDQTSYTAALYAAQQAGIDLPGVDPTYDPAKVAALKQNLLEAYQLHQGAMPAKPEEYTLSPGQTRFSASGAVKSSVPAVDVSTKVPPVGTPAHEAYIRQQLLLQQQGAHPAEEGGPPAAPPAAPPNLTVGQVEGTEPAPAPAPAAPDYGTRHGSTAPKGQGFLGPLKRPDGGVMSEFSIDVTFDGKPVQIPTLVPTLTRSEVQQLLTMRENDPLPPAIEAKAVAFAKQRMAAGKDPFAGPGEQQIKFPDLAAPGGPRAGMTENQAWLKAYEDQAAAKKKAETDKHSPQYIEWEDYRAQGGTLGFDAYMERDANRHKAVTRINTGQATDDDVETVVDGMIAGTLPPQLPGRASPAYTKMLAVAHRKGYNLAQAVTDWMATTKHLQTMNGAQQLRLTQAIKALPEMLDKVDTLAQQWKGTGFPALNRANLTLAKGGAFGTKAAEIANQLDAQIADVVADLGNVYMGGNSPTDHALSLAAKSLSAEWSEPVLRKMVALAKENVQIRLNSINSSGVAGASADNPYAAAPPPPRTEPPPPAGPKVGDRGILNGQLVEWQTINGQSGWVPVKR